MRLFIAIGFPDEIKTALYGEASALRKFSLQGNFSRKENLHLTLAFLGEVHQSRVKEIRAVMDMLPKRPLSLEISEFGWFSGRGERLYWRGVAGNPALETLQRKLCAMLRTAGFAPDDKPFRPHITLARRCVLQPDFSLEAFRNGLETLAFPVDGISLMRSERIGSRLVYTEMYKAKLL